MRRGSGRTMPQLEPALALSTQPPSHGRSHRFHLRCAKVAALLSSASSSIAVVRLRIHGPTGKLGRGPVQTNTSKDYFATFSRLSLTFRNTLFFCLVAPRLGRPGQQEVFIQTWTVKEIYFVHSPFRRIAEWMQRRSRGGTANSHGANTTVANPMRK